jgi:hypothetical protein
MPGVGERKRSEPPLRGPAVSTSQCLRADGELDLAPSSVAYGSRWPGRISEKTGGE